MMIIATICLSLMAAMVKFLGHLPVMEIIFFRSLPIMLIIPIILKNKKIPFWGNNKPLLLLRSLFSCFVVIAYFYFCLFRSFGSFKGICKVSVSLSPLSSSYFYAYFKD